MTLSLGVVDSPLSWFDHAHERGSGFDLEGRLRVSLSYRVDIAFMSNCFFVTGPKGGDLDE